MKKIIFSIIFIAAIFNWKYAIAQVDSIKYTDSFKFINGIYKTYNEFKNNNPSIKEKAIITEEVEDAPYLFGGIYSERIKYYDSLGVLQKINRRKVWGYCSKGKIYVMLHNNFHQIFIIGTIMHFAEVKNANIIDTYNIAQASNPPLKHIQYLIDFKSGNIYRYKLKKFIPLLRKDKVLFDEFNSIKSGKKKKQSMFIYLNIFNERNPIYFKV